MRKKVIVTGATGFLGGWLIPHLLENDFEVIAVLNPRSSANRRESSGYAVFRLEERCLEERIDITDYSAVESLVLRHAPDVLIHMAAVGDVTVANRLPKTTFETSATSTVNFLEALRLHSPDTLFLSHTTDKVYGGNPTPFCEDMRFNPVHIYEVAKVSQELLTRSYAQHYGTKAVTVRCGNYFGGYDYNFNRIVPYTIRQALRGENVVLRSNGKFTRDFLYIKDAVLLTEMFIDGHFSQSSELSYGEAYNFSLEIELSVIELVRRILAIMDSNVEVEIDGQAQHEIANMRLSCVKAREELGWAPKYTLDAGLAETVDSYASTLAKKERSHPWHALLGILASDTACNAFALSPAFSI
jgi:CDP-glucose 4,6-dehydratase